MYKLDKFKTTLFLSALQFIFLLRPNLRTCQRTAHLAYVDADESGRCQELWNLLRYESVALLLTLRLSRSRYFFATSEVRNIIGFINNIDFTFSTFSVQSILPKELQFVLQDMKGPLAGAALSTPVEQAELSGYNYNGNPVHACGCRSMGLTVVLVGLFALPAWLGKQALALSNRVLCST